MADTVLLVEDDPDEAQALIRALSDPRAGPCNVEWVTSLAQGLERLKSAAISVVLLDLFLPDSVGVETFDRLLRAAPRIPILILSSLADENVALYALRRGATDYLLKGHLGGYSLPQTLRNIIERGSAKEALFVETERARITLDSIGDAVLSTDLAGNVSYLNRVAETMTGWSQTEATGQPLGKILRIIDGVTRKPAPDPLEVAVRHNKAGSLTANCVLIRRDGHEIAIEDAAAPICDSAGHVTGAVMVFHDVKET